MNKKISFCIYGLGTYPLLTKSKQDSIGGAELQQALLGIELSHENNIEVSFITFDHGQSPYKIVNGIRIFKTKPKMYLVENKGLVPLIKTIFVNWQVLTKCDADIYYSRGAGKYTGIISLYCKVYRKKFIMGMALDEDLDGSFEKRAKIYEKFSFFAGIKFADRIIAQNKKQKDLLKQRFRRESVLINNMHYTPPLNSFRQRGPIIWVGTIRPSKQPDIFIKLAKEFTNIQFQMIGGESSDNTEYFEKIKELAQDVINLKFVGFVPYPQINEYFDKASIFVNTSRQGYEGFPNTFIQAWIRGVPVVSLYVDPDELICRHKLGFHSKTFEQMVTDVNILLTDIRLRENLGLNARMYAETEYDIKNVIKQYLGVINQLMVNNQ